MPNLISDQDKTLTIANVINVFNGDMSTFISAREDNDLTVDEFKKLYINADMSQTTLDFNALVTAEWNK